MLRNYFYITLRILRKNLLYSGINVLGFAVGMACCLLITLFVAHEWSYDRHYDHGEKFYRVKSEIQLGENSDVFARTPYILAPTMKKELPDVDQVTRIQGLYQPVLKIKGEKKQGRNSFYADEDVFSLFQIELTKGKVENWLENPNQVIISETVAERYFSGENPLGQTIHFHKIGELEVKGVMKEPDHHSHIDFQMILPFSWQEKSVGSGALRWDMIVTCTYFSTHEPVEDAEFEGKLNALIPGPDAEVEFMVDRVDDIYLSANAPGDLGTQSNIKYIYIFASIALLILLIASLNFVSLASARSIERANEVGVRKVFGASRQNLIYQFLGEAFVLVGMAIILSLGIAELSLPYFNQLIGRELTLPLFTNVWFIPLLILLGAILAILAGSYPALVISGFSPKQVLGRKATVSGSAGGTLRLAMVGLQFVITFVLISSTLIINKQLDFLNKKDLGFNEEQVVVIRLKGDELRNNYQNFKQDLLSFPGVENVAASYHTPGNGLGIYYFNIEGEKEEIPLANYSVDYDFITALELDVVEGRAFSSEMTTDSSKAFMVNEAFVKKFGWEGNVIGKDIQFDEKKGKVIGVLEDFHFTSLYEPISPLVMHIESYLFSRLSVRVQPGKLEDVIKHAEANFNQYAPEEIFEYTFVDEDMGQAYADARRTSKVLSIFSFMAILIACLGLLGMVVANTLKKSKEIGIRKVLGASSAHIFILLLKHYAWIISLSFIVALPVTIWLVNKWLAGFAYTVEPGVFTFVIAFLVICLSGLLTVGYFSFKASTADPIDALRYE